MINDFFDLLNTILYNEYFVFRLESPLGSLPFVLSALWAVWFLPFILWYAPNPPLLTHRPSGHALGEGGFFFKYNYLINIK